MSGLIGTLVFLGSIAVVVVYSIYRIVRRGFDLKLLVEDGVEAVGTVSQKLQFATAKGSRRNDRYLIYEYEDPRGVRHRHRSSVTSEFWRSHEEGGPIDIVYSRSRPEISAPRGLVEKARKAIEGKKL